MDAVAKWLVLANISSIQIIAVRSWMMIPVILLTLFLRGNISRLKTKQPLMHAARGLFGFLAPFEYTALIWAALIGYLVWTDILSLRMWTGAAIIISCGLYVIHRESLHK
jgi:hypothetical protein